MRPIYSTAVLVSALACGARSALVLQEDGHVDPRMDSGDVSTLPSDATGDAAPALSDTSDSMVPAQEADRPSIDASESDASDAGIWFVPVNEAGAQPFCGPRGTLDGLSVWSDDRGVFVLTDQSPAAEVIESNNDGGWQEVYRGKAQSQLMRLGGFANGPLVLYGLAACGIRFVEAGASHCSAPISFSSGVNTVRSNLAYAVEGDSVLRYQGSLWMQLDVLQPAGQVQAQSIWSDGNVLLIVSSPGGVFVSTDGGAFTPQTGLPSARVRSAWGFALDDLWVGDDSGNLVHSDGTRWGVSWTDTACGGRSIMGLWGVRGTVFFYTRSSVGYWDGSRVHLILDAGCGATAEVTSLWGNSPNEVFFTIRDSAQADSSCGAAAVMLYDGTSVRRL